MEQITPDIIFMVGSDNPIDETMHGLINDFSNNIVFPFMPIANQLQLKIPLSLHQTVMVSDISSLENDFHDLRGRPIILHLDRNNLRRLPDVFERISQDLGSVTLRPKRPQEYTAEDIAFYEEQLVTWGIHSYRCSAGSRLFRIMNINLAATHNNCPARSNALTIGPDGMIYPCPAFYHAGQQHALGRADNVTDFHSLLKAAKQSCGLCQGANCAGCMFTETETVASNNICRLREAEQRAEHRVLKAVSCSAHLMYGLQMQEADMARIISELEDPYSLMDIHQIHDIHLNDFAEALCDINRAAQLIESNATPAALQDLQNKWGERTGVLPYSRAAIFRRRVREIIEELAAAASFECRIVSNTEVLDDLPTPFQQSSSEEQSEIDLFENVYSLSADELAAFIKVYMPLAGWEYLVAEISADVAAGFNLESELLLAKTQLYNSEARSMDWLNRIIREKQWPYMPGRTWKVDLKSGRVYPVLQTEVAAHQKSMRKLSICAIEGATYIARLFSVDKEVIFRLNERRALATEELRKALMRQCKDSLNCTDEELNGLASVLGCACQDVNEWFEGMTKAYEWSKPNDSIFLLVDNCEHVLALNKESAVYN